MIKFFIIFLDFFEDGEVGGFEEMDLLGEIIAVLVCINFESLEEMFDII